MKHAIIKDGTVINIVVAEQAFAEQQGWVQCPDDVSVGWLYDGATFSEDPNLAAQVIAYQEKMVRNERNKLLADCDWIVIMHTEKGTNIPAAWEIYRQSLRDITSQQGFPHTINWPTKPE